MLLFKNIYIYNTEQLLYIRLHIITTSEDWSQVNKSIIAHALAKASQFSRIMTAQTNERHPRAVPSDGGYYCEFVEPPPSTLQTECPICLLILKEPCLISCCGHKFCRECIERLERDRKPCALCNEPNFTFMRERAMERSLKDLDVWCSYRKEGCEWNGKLGKLEEHLNPDTSPEDQLTLCQFVNIECMYRCGAWLQQRHITTHETQECMKRPYSCDHCRDYSSIFEDVVKVHYPQCGKYPVPCPNNCDVYMFERQNLENHLREQCPFAMVDCPFRFAGCETQLPRKDILEHTKENIHITLLATATQKLSSKVQKKEDELQELRTAYKSVKEEVQKQKLKVQELESVVNSTGPRVNYPSFFIKSHLKKVEVPFYTHPHGYRMCVSVYPNGHGDGEGTHVSIFVFMMQGPYDDYLKWPFQGEITIQIDNQAGDHNHIETVIEYTPYTRAYAVRVTDKERSDNGLGNHQFLPHDKLHYNARRKTQYLKNDTLHVRVVNVTLN